MLRPPVPGYLPPGSHNCPRPPASPGPANEIRTDPLRDGLRAVRRDPGDRRLLLPRRRQRKRREGTLDGPELLAGARGLGGPQPPDFLAIVAPGMTMNRPLRPTDVKAVYEWSSPPPAVWPARARRRVGVWVWNRGPVGLSSFGGLFNRGAVVLRGTWRTDGGHSEPAQPAQGIWLSSRLSAGEAIKERSSSWVRTSRAAFASRSSSFKPKSDLFPAGDPRPWRRR